MDCQKQVLSRNTFFGRLKKYFYGYFWRSSKKDGDAIKRPEITEPVTTFPHFHTKYRRETD